LVSILAQPLCFAAAQSGLRSPTPIHEKGKFMPFLLSQASISAFEVGLNALSAVLDKAEKFAADKKIDPAVLLHTRLAPDMFDLTRQVQVATDQARRGSARLAGAEPPSYEDSETTIDQLKARLAKTIAYLQTLDRKQIDASADREIKFPLGGGVTGEMKGDDYLNHFVLPNFYFHLTAAYAILRHCGVNIGKRDFLGAIPVKRI
jgi:uncharacterized protein